MDGPPFPAWGGDPMLGKQGIVPWGLSGVTPSGDTCLHPHYLWWLPLCRWRALGTL